MLQPCEQFGHTDAERSSSHARALLSESFESSAPTGHRSITLPAHACVRSCPSNFPISARSPRSATLSTGSCATSSMKRTQRVQRMQRLATYMTSPPKSSTGLKRFGSRYAALGAAFLIRVVLQLALARLIADRAVERMVDEQHLEHALARFERLRRVDVHHLPLGDRRRARGRELRRLLHFDEAHAADAGDGKAGVIAVVRDQHARRLRRLEDRGAVRHGDRASLDRQIDLFTSAIRPPARAPCEPSSS